MLVQYELTQINRQDKALTLASLSTATRQQILRLLDRQGCSVQNLETTREGPSWLYIDPQAPLVLVWGLLYMLVFYLVQLQISFSIAFGPAFFEQELQWTSLYLPVYLSFLVFLLADMGLNCIKGYYVFAKGKVVDDSRKIIVHYLRGQFLIDLVTVSLYAVPLFSESFGLNFMQLIPAILLWVKKFKYQGEVESFLQYKAGLRAGFMLFVLFVDALLFGNYGACVFIWMDKILYNEGYYGTGSSSAYYWLTNNSSYPLSLIAGPWYYQYVYGQQFATGTLSTLAPGPFPKNPWEALYAIFMVILFMIYASYLGDVLIQIFSTYAERRMHHEDNIRSFDNFMRLKQVTQALRMRVYNYFELKWQLEFRTESTQQEEMIHRLPLNLKQELLLEIGFSKNLYFLYALPKQQQLRNMIALKIRRATADANTCIFRDHQLTLTRPRSLYFIKEGMAKFYLANTPHRLSPAQAVLSLTNVERVLGVYQFVTGQDYSVCCLSIDLCLVQSLSWADFADIVAELRIQEEIHEFRHRVLVERELQLINKVCVVCLQCHIEADCPRLYFSKVFQKNILGSESRTSQNQRSRFKRKGTTSGKVDKRGEQSHAYVFEMVSNLNLGLLFLEVLRREQRDAIKVEKVAFFRNYFPAYNLRPCCSQAVRRWEEWAERREDKS